MPKSESALKSKLLDEQKLGFYTEFFVEAGRLDESSPRFQFGNRESFFDLASLTKGLATGPLVYHFLKGHLNTPLNELIPALHTQGYSKAVLALTPNELLAHRSGLSGWRNLWITHLREGPLDSPKFLNPLIQKTFARINPSSDKADVYSDLGFILLGFTLEAFTGRSLQSLWQEF
ncbi:MAG: serine hydrolase, partial [Bdellovibrionota bacterium]